MPTWPSHLTCAQINQRVGCDNSPQSPLSARTWPCWLNRSVRDHAATPSSWRRDDGVEAMIQPWPSRAATICFMHTGRHALRRVAASDLDALVADDHIQDPGRLLAVARRARLRRAPRGHAHAAHGLCPTVGCRALVCWWSTAALVAVSWPRGDVSNTKQAARDCPRLSIPRSYRSVGASKPYLFAVLHRPANACVRHWKMSHPTLRRPGTFVFASVMVSSFFCRRVSILSSSTRHGC